MRISILFGVIFAFSMTATAANPPAPPPPAVSEHLTTDGAGFMVDDGKLLYATDFKLNQPSQSPIYVVIEFESPVKDEPLAKVEQTVAPGQASFRARSDPFSRIRNGETYRVSISLYSDAEHQAPIGTHRQEILFYAPEDVLRSLGIGLL
ncbi:hypothetical protein [Arenimonas alkanexedens]